jgi:hypothetical protein
VKELSSHPTVRRVRERAASATPGAGTGAGPEVLDAGWLRRLCLDAGADDVGFVPVDHPDLAAKREYIDEVLPGIASLIGFVVRTNVDNLRSPARATANLEFHTAYDGVDHVARRIACAPPARRSSARGSTTGAASPPRSSGPSSTRRR